jgi:hypothetical protein
VVRLERVGPGDTDHVEVPGPIQMIIDRALYAGWRFCTEPLAVSLGKESRRRLLPGIARTES